MMAYQSPGFVTSILHNNQPVREFTENGCRACIVPFGSEYKIRLKNKTNKRCKVKIFIDGMNINYNAGGDGVSLILYANQSIDLERFIEDFKSGNKFKFVSLEEGTRTGEIQDPTSLENGLIRVEFHPEKDLFTTLQWLQYQHLNCWCKLNTCLCEGGRKSYYTNTSNQSIFPSTTLTNSQYGGTLNSDTSNTTLINSTPSSTGFFHFNNVNVSNNSNAQTKGATVQGSVSNQNFVAADGNFQTDTATIITLKMRGPKAQVQPGHEPTKPFEVSFKENLITVSHDGNIFISSKDAKISLTEKGLSIEGKGISIQSRDFKVIS